MRVKITFSESQFLQKIANRVAGENPDPKQKAGEGINTRIHDPIRQLTTYPTPLYEGDASGFYVSI